MRIPFTVSDSVLQASVGENAYAQADPTAEDCLGPYSPIDAVLRKLCRKFGWIPRRVYVETRGGGTVAYGVTFTKSRTPSARWREHIMCETLIFIPDDVEKRWREKAGGKRPH